MIALGWNARRARSKFSFRSDNCSGRELYGARCIRVLRTLHLDFIDPKKHRRLSSLGSRRRLSYPFHRRAADGRSIYFSGVMRKVNCCGVLGTQ